MPREEKTRPPEDSIREHTYDGIQEYNKRLPNWWLFTLYGSIVFSFFYWFYYHQTGVGSFDKEILTNKLAAIEEAAAASQGQVFDDAGLWAMSRDTEVIAAGKATFEANCVACHLASLRGKEENPAAIGPSLVDSEWIHGGNPSDIMTVVVGGVPDKGMLAWGSILGEKRISEVAAYVLSHHTPPAE